MALCPTCDTVIPCHCHLTPPTQLRPGVYLTTETQPENETPATAVHTQQKEAKQ